MDVGINIGNHKVIASGSFVTDKEENTLFLDYNGEKLICTFLIKDTTDRSSSSLRWYPSEDGKGIVIEFVGFRDALGKTSTEPMLLAKLNSGEDLLLRCVIRDIGNKIKTVDYTFFLGIKNG